ncbi:GNAT family N-acetyltransferase [Nonomuraea pusilla]|uniref:GNAT family N-acetyltransferase n=1 Tax=Nonomuraea pusilla TaxID=46177 RepID=UPI003316A94D
MNDRPRIGYRPASPEDGRRIAAHRGLGVGSALMERACAHGRRLGARTAWLETSNVNSKDL